MATIAFGDKPGAATPTAAASVENGGLSRETEGTPSNATPAPAADSAVATVPQTDGTVALPPATGFVGAWSRKFVRLPRINLIHKTSDGDMIEKFGIGSFSLEKTGKLSNGKTPITLTALVAALDYQQKLPFGTQEQPNVVATPEDVIACGGSLNYADVKSGKFYGPRAHIQFVFPLPAEASEDASALFPYEFEGAPYGMAMLTVASSAFTSVGKELITLCNNNKVMRKGMEFGKLELTSETRKKGDLDWKIPVIKFVGENSAELIAFYRTLL